MREPSQYNIKIVFADGNTIDTSVMARGRSDVKRMVMDSEEYRTLIANGAVVVDFKIEHVVEKRKPRPTRFRLSNVPFEEKWYQVADYSTMLIVKFRRNHYDKLDVFPIDGMELSQEQEIAKELVIANIKAWLDEYFPELVATVERRVPKNEGVHPRQANRTEGNVHFYCTLQADTAAFIKEQAKELGMKIGQYIDYMLTEDEG